MTNATASQNDPVNALSKYLLRGWVLTNNLCTNAPSCVVPLLRSKDKSLYFCVNCDPNPELDQPNVKTAPVNGLPDAAKVEEAVLESATNELTANYTPKPAEKETAHPEEDEDEVDDDDWVVPEESEASKARREQSSLASKLMGPKLLQGYTMLDTACPNATCFGIPLLRDRSQRTHCVICENASRQHDTVKGREPPQEDIVNRKKMIPKTQAGSQQTASSVDAVRKHAAVGENKAEIKSSPRKRCKIIESSHIPSSNAQATPAESNSALWENFESNVSLLSLAISRKLEWLRKELEVEVDLNRIQQLCVTVETCVRAGNTCGEAL